MLLIGWDTAKARMDAQDENFWMVFFDAGADTTRITTSEPHSESKNLSSLTVFPADFDSIWEQVVPAAFPQWFDVGNIACAGAESRDRVQSIRSLWFSTALKESVRERFIGIKPDGSPKWDPWNSETTEYPYFQRVQKKFRTGKDVVLEWEKGTNKIKSTTDQDAVRQMERILSGKYFFEDVLLPYGSNAASKSPSDSNLESKTTADSDTPSSSEKIGEVGGRLYASPDSLPSKFVSKNLE